MKLTLFCLSLVAASLSTAASAQSSFMADVIGQAAGGYSGGEPDSCFDGRQRPKPEGIASASVRADKAFGEYRALAASKASLKPLFYDKKNWDFDGAVQDAAAATDPWADRISRVERVSLTVANTGRSWFRGIWNAFAADGSLLGSYDAMMQAGRGSAGFISLALRSPGSAAHSEPDVPFCSRPGDIERWNEARAKREAEKAAKRAAKEAGLSR